MSINIITSDNQSFNVEKEIISLSTTIKNMLEDLQDLDDVPIPIHNIRGEIFSKVNTYISEYHKNGQPTEEWLKEFFNIPHEILFEIMLGANYLEITSLLNETCKFVAGMMKGKTPEEIRKLFNIPNDFTPEEEEQIRKENYWCEEV